MTDEFSTLGGEEAGETAAQNRHEASDTVIPEGTKFVTEHPDFKGADSVPNDSPAAAGPKTAAVVSPWEPQAPITSAQVADVISRAQAAARGVTFRFDQPAQHPSMAGSFTIRKQVPVEGRGMMATLRDTKTGAEFDFPAAEIFDPVVAERIAVEVQQGPAGAGMGGAMRGAAAVLIACCMFLAGCVSTGTLPANATTQQKALAAVTKAEVAAQPITTALVSTGLVVISDPVKRASVANKIVAAADSINTLLTGKIPTAAELRQQVTAYVGDDPDALRIAQVIAANYASIYPMFNIAGRSPVVFIQKVATGAHDAALMFATPAAP